MLCRIYRIFRRRRGRVFRPLVYHRVRGVGRLDAGFFFSKLAGCMGSVLRFQCPVAGLHFHFAVCQESANNVRNVAYLTDVEPHLVSA